MIIDGIDVSKLTPSDVETSTFPTEVVGRVLQLDGDAACYKVTYNPDECIDTCISNFFTMVEYRRKMSGSTTVNIHLTGRNKGGRYKQATVRKYQGNRDGKKKPENLLRLRDYLINSIPRSSPNIKNTYTVILHENQEADDGMAQENYKAIKNGKRELSVIQAEDKDLCMCSGLHCNWNSFEIVDVNGFGGIYLDESTSQKKIKGYGTSFFWSQLLTGDTADNIPGLEKVGASILDIYKPLKKHNPKRKPGLCGPVVAYKILEHVKTDWEAFCIVVDCYRSYYGDRYVYTSWDGVEIVRRSSEMLLEQAQLLWMRRTIVDEVSTFFKDVVEGRQWDGREIQ